MKYLLFIPVLLLFGCQKEKCYVCKTVVSELYNTEVRSKDSAESIYCGVTDDAIASINSEKSYVVGTGGGVTIRKVLVTKCEKK